MRYARGLGLVLAILIVGGCSTAAQHRDEPTPIQAQPTLAADPANLPQVELSAKLLYQLLVAEFAAQEGEAHLSAQAYLQTARTTRDPRLASRATRMAVFSRDMGMALQAAQLWVELEPDNLDARQSLAALLLRHGHTEQATEQMRQLIEVTPQGPGHGLMLIANLLTQENDRQLALRIMQQLAGEYPDEQLGHYAHAHVAHQVGAHDHALGVLDTLLKRWPKMLDARVLQARIHQTLGNQDAALESINTAVGEHPDNLQIRLIYARMLVDAHRLDEARQQFRILQRSQSNDPDILYALALLAMEAGDLNEAESHFLQLIQLGERDEEARIALGQIAHQREQLDEAIEWFQSISVDSERYIEAQIQAAQLLLEQRDLDTALGYLRALRLFNQEDIARRYMGEAELIASTGDLPAAMEVYDEGVALFKDHAELRYGRALLAERMDRLELAEQDLRHILTIDPEHVHALNALGYTLVDRTERHQEGLEYIQRAYAQLPDEPAILDSMGWAYYRLGRLEEAENYLRRAFAQLPDAEIAAHLGEVLWMRGKREEARQIWQQGREQDSDNPVLLKTLQRLAP